MLHTKFRLALIGQAVSEKKMFEIVKDDKYRWLYIKPDFVWPTLFLLNVSTALKGTHNYIFI